MTIEDLAQFTDELWDQLYSKALRPRFVTNPVTNQVTQAPPYPFPVTCLHRLKMGASMVRYHETCSRNVTAGNMQLRVLREYDEHLKVLLSIKKKDPPKVPLCTKTLGFINWTESMPTYLNSIVGDRSPPVPLSYIICEDRNMPEEAPVFANNHPYSIVHGSVQSELIARASHDHHLFPEDNKKVYEILEEALRGTPYAPAMKPFERTKDGRAAWIAVTSQYAGLDKWKAMLASAEEMINNRKWNGSNTSYSLEKFIQQHRSAFVTLTQCSERVPYQLPNEHTRVTKVLANIESNDAKLLSALANVQADGGEQGKMHDFEAMAAYILPYDPVKSRRKLGQSKRKGAEISEVTSTITDGKRSKTIQVSGKQLKIGVGKTGVDLRYHTPEEFNKLSQDQRDELMTVKGDREKRGLGRHLPGGPPKGSSSNRTQRKYDKKQMKSTISECIAELKDDNDNADILQQLVKALGGKAEPTPKSTTDEQEATKATISSFLNKIKKRV